MARLVPEPGHIPQPHVQVQVQVQLQPLESQGVAEHPAVIHGPVGADFRHQLGAGQHHVQDVAAAPTPR
ncbi:hypothetical protein ACIO7M_32740 [Streptomyces toxytricini]|uniref:Uncharacterized protein n=1 Tax=Streptomyces toxytricini TaxID=67369 RepID=A0ABW8ERE2_STRT5